MSSEMSKPIEKHRKDRRGSEIIRNFKEDFSELPEAPQAPSHPSQLLVSRGNIEQVSVTDSIPTSPPLSPSRRTFEGCSSLSAYRLGLEIGLVIEYLIILGSGTFGTVLEGIEKSTGRKFALKNIKINSEREGMPMTAMREIRILKKLKSRYIISLHEIAVKPGNRGLSQTFMVLLVL
jgi:hypothetical protein